MIPYHSSKCLKVFYTRLNVSFPLPGNVMKIISNLQIQQTWFTPLFASCLPRTQSVSAQVPISSVVTISSKPEILLLRTLTKTITAYHCLLEAFKPWATAALWEPTEHLPVKRKKFRARLMWEGDLTFCCHGSDTSVWCTVFITQSPWQRRSPLPDHKHF